MKKTPLRRKSKSPQKKLEDKIWQLCREITDARYPNTCYTCGTKGLEGVNKQLGHMWAKASVGAYLKYDLRLLRWQCYRCNINHGGMGADFYKNMTKEVGVKNMKKLEIDRQVTVKASDHYEKIYQEYLAIKNNL
jgi:hypothetical protein